MDDQRFLSTKVFLVKAMFVVVPIAMIFFILNVFLPDAAEKYRRFDFGGGQEYQTINTPFLLYLKEIPESPEEIGLLVENFYLAFENSYGDELGFRGVSDRVGKVKIFFFSNRHEFDEYYLKVRNRTIPHNSAYYDPNKGLIVLYWTQSNQETLYHELTHMIFDLALEVDRPHWSPWFSEGVAMYFEKTQVRRGSLIPEALDRRIVNQVKNAWQEKKFIPLRELCQSSYTRFIEEGNALYYHESYLFVYFLLHAEDGKYRDAFFKYFREESQKGACPPEILWRILDQGPEQIQRSFCNFFSIEK